MDEIIEENVAKQTTYLLGEQSGLEKGIQESKKEMVLNMINNHLSLEMISKYTNLSISELEEIVKETK